MLGRISHVFGAAVFAAALIPADVTLGQSAPAVDDKTLCSAVGSSTSALGRAKFTAINAYIRDVMMSADADYGKRRRVEIIPKLSHDGMEDTLAMVFVTCRDKPNRTIRAQSLDVYESMRAMQRSLGVKGL